MSHALNPIRPVKVIDPSLDWNTDKFYAVLQGGTRVSWKPIISTSFSNSSASFSAPPPNPSVSVGRNIKLVQPVTIDFVGNAPLGQALLQSQYDAPRAYPLSSTMQTLQIDINNISVSINMSDTIQALLRYHNKENLKQGELSLTPSLMDQSQEYSDLANSIRNPLASYIDSNDGAVQGRGAFPIDAITNNISTGIGNDTTAQLQYTFCEDLFLSPLLFGTDCLESDFIGIQTFQVTINWSTALSRMWCHDNSGGTTLTSVAVTLGQPILLFEYKTPPQTEPIPRSISYPYYEIQRYPTEAGASIASGASTILSSSNIQLNSIPRHMFIYARKRNQDLSFTDTDTFFSIERVSINWANNSGLLSNATKRDLYAMSHKNGCNLSWTQWSGESNYLMSGSTIQEINGPGSVLCVEFGTDLGLELNEAPGLNGTYQLQMEVTVQNRSAASIIPALYVVVVNEGTFTIENNSAYAQIGVISHNDVLDSNKQIGINYGELKNMAGAAIFRNLGRRLKKFVKDIPQLIKKYGPAAKEIFNIAKKAYGSGAGAGRMNPQQDLDMEYEMRAIESPEQQVDLYRRQSGAMY